MLGVVVYLELGGVIGLPEVMGHEGEPRSLVEDQVVAHWDRISQAGPVVQDQHLFAVEAATSEVLLATVFLILVPQEPLQVSLTAVAEMPMVETATVPPGVGAARFRGTVQFCREAHRSLQSDVCRIGLGFI